MINICRIHGCTEDAVGKGYRCEEHATNCLAENCDVPSTPVRCSKHAARYSRLGHSALACKHAGCKGEPVGDRAVCAEHLKNGVEYWQEELDAAYALLAQYGKVTFSIR